MIWIYCICGFGIIFLLYLDYKKGKDQGFKGQEEMKLPYTIDYYILKIGLIVLLILYLLLVLDRFL